MLRATVLGLLVVFSIMDAHSKQPPPSAGKNTNINQEKTTAAPQTPADDKRGTKEAPLSVEITNPPNGNEIAAEIKKNRDDQTAENRRSIVSNSLLVAVGFLQACALIFTIFVTNKAANAAKAAADAAVASQRPWIKIDINEIASDFVDDGRGRRLEFGTCLINIGATPATNLNPWVAMACGSINKALEKIPPHREGIGNSLFPNDPIEPSLFGRITQEEIDAASNIAEIAVIASVTYQFSGGNGHTTKAYMLSGAGSLLGTIDQVPRNRLSLREVPIFDKCS